MPERDPRLAVDYASLAETLTVLAYEARLELLDLLRFPHAVPEIRLAPHRTQGGDNPDRPMSKQAVQAHLDQLVDTGLVRMEPREVDGRTLNTYTANAQRLYALVEDLRGLCARYAANLPVGNDTGTVASTAPRAAHRGPRLVLVHGVYEGKAFPLDASTADERGWTIGRRKDLPVSLDYDPFVSSEHALVRKQDDGFVLHDLPSSKNGTFLNWVLVPKGGVVPLEAGDVIGAGRSLLTFAGAPAAPP